MLKKLPSKAKTKPKTPTTKNGKFVITFNVFGTPVEVKIMMKQSKQNKNILSPNIHFADSLNNRCI
jgi:hypothetical protein